MRHVHFGLGCYLVAHVLQCMSTIMTRGVTTTYTSVVYVLYLLPSQPYIYLSWLEYGIL